MPHRPMFSRPLTAACLAMAALWSAPTAHAIVNGTPTTSFQAVGELGGASGVLIADNWVLTAAHVANSLTIGASSFDSLNGSSLISGIHTFSNESFPAHDIALVQLSTSLHTATPFLNDLLITPGQVASLGTLTMASAQNQVPNGYATTTAYSAPSTHTSDDGIPHTVNWLLTDGLARVQGGDSGSALFMGEASDSAGEVLLGIASAILFNDKAGSAESSAYVQLAHYRNWIDATMASSGQQAIWVSSVPEPSGLLLCGLGALAILTRRDGHFGRNG
jgi:V8-like Glu-specific endopeptidase